MTTDTEEAVAAPVEHDADHMKHPTPGQYWLIALILAVVTALEIAASYVDALDGAPVVITLLVLGAVKFGMVVALFMHLKFDKPLYRAFFIIGLVGAIGMFVVVLLTFRAL